MRAFVLKCQWELFANTFKFYVTSTPSQQKPFPWSKNTMTAYLEGEKKWVRRREGSRMNTKQNTHSPQTPSVSKETFWLDESGLANRRQDIPGAKWFIHKLRNTLSSLAQKHEIRSLFSGKVLFFDDTSHKFLRVDQLPTRKCKLWRTMETGLLSTLILNYFQCMKLCIL